MYAIIIPYMHSEERFENLKMTMNSLPSVGIEIFVHEIGNTQMISPSKFVAKNINWMFSEWKEPFHRAWAINKMVRKLPNGVLRLVIMDADLILPEYYFSNINYNWDTFQIGWNKLFYLSELATLNYKHTGIINEEPDLTVTKYYKTPDPRGGCGGITLIDRDLFEKVKGIPEDFRGTWGREDNSFVYKMMNLGYSFKMYNAKIYHLHHSSRTIKDKSIQDKFLTMQHWDKVAWEHKISEIGDNWGK